ncbi:MAG: hypothetical protein ABJ242_04170 [Marinomonas sp.]
MKLVKGQRPWPIWVFLGAFLGSAIDNYWQGMSALPLKQEIYALYFPGFDWTRDWTIVALSAVLSIAFIPAGLIFFRASKIARWLVTGFSLLGLLNAVSMIGIWIEGSATNFTYLREPVLNLLALVMLWSPSANRYFAKEEPVDVSTFD